ncbi:hypothetical protein [Archangium sp.]|uniref:hypothetical protein n=1 Tax=Archangium sp. TaxID=1872627 RepID=UPI002D666A97|nr:hypothetical protein [Archangium sp.]HYO58787.1 hypothetical protein [Archangium sp.]
MRCRDRQALGASPVSSFPLRNVRSVELAPSHLGKRILGRQLLRVRFSRAGTEDTIAWLVPEPRHWLERLQSAR